MANLHRKLQKPLIALLLCSKVMAQDPPQIPGPGPVPGIPVPVPDARLLNQQSPGQLYPDGTVSPGHVSGVPQSARLLMPQIPSGSTGAQALFQDSPQTLPGVPPVPEVPPGLDDSQPWTFNFQQAPWTTVIRSFCDSSGYSLQMIAEPIGTFTYYDARAYSTTEAIDVFNDHLMANGFILVREGRRLTLTNATSEIPGNIIPFVTIHQLDGLGRNELASVAIPLKSTDAAQALEEIRQLQSSVGQVKALTNSGRVIVTDTGSYLRRMRDLLLGSGIAAGDEHASVYQLRHAQAEDVAKAITDFLNTAGMSGGVGADGAPISSGGSNNSGQRVVAEKTTNSLLVRGTTEEMATIQQLILDLDRAPREVLVQALLVEVELGNTNELGVELGFQDSVLFDRSVVDKLVTISQTTTAPNGTQTTNQQIISQTAAPGFNFNNQPLGNNIAANPSKVGSQGLSNFGIGRVNGDLGFGGLVLSAGSESVNVLLRALDAQFNIDVLSRPQVRAIENKEAFIQIGQQVPVVDGVAVTPVGSANPVIRQDQAGIILKVTPRISPDGRVQLDVNAEKSAFNLTPGTGVPIFTDATNGNVIEAPIKDVTTADTTVSVQSGQTVVLGGMITNDQMVVTRKVPWLGDIPILGRLFRYDLDRHKRKELLVFLTPIMLEDDAHAEFLKSREVEKIHMPAEAFSFGDELTGTYSATADSVMVPTSLSGPKNGTRPAAKAPVRLAGHSPAVLSSSAGSGSERLGSSASGRRGPGGWSSGPGAGTLASSGAPATTLRSQETKPAAPKKERSWPLKSGIPWMKKKPDVSAQDMNPVPAAARPELSPEVLRQQQQRLAARR